MMTCPETKLESLPSDEHECHTADRAEQAIELLEIHQLGRTSRGAQVSSIALSLRQDAAS